MDFSYLYGYMYEYIFPLLITVAAFIYVLFVRNNKKANTAFVFMLIGFLIVVEIFYYSMIQYYLVCTLMAISIVALLSCNKKGTVATAWISSIAMVVINLLSCIFLDAFLITNVYIIEMFICNIPILIGIALMVTATIIRSKRIKSGELMTENSSRCVSWRIGSIFSVISFIAVLIGIENLIMFLHNSKMGFTDDYTKSQEIVLIISFMIALVSGIVGCTLLHNTKKQIDKNLLDGDFTVIDWTLYIWSAIIVFIAYLIMLFIIFMLSFMGDKNYRKAGIKEVTDEDGNKHTLDYKGEEREEVIDENGKVWVTDDGGLHFRERDKYVLKDKEGKEKTVYDPYGSTGGHSNTVVDEKGNVYDVDNWGNATKRGDDNE